MARMRSAAGRGIVFFLSLTTALGCKVTKHPYFDGPTGEGGSSGSAGENSGGGSSGDASSSSASGGASGNAGASSAPTGGTSSGTTVTALAVSTTILPAGYYNDAYSYSLAAAGGSGTGYSYSLTSGSLPNGITLASTGVLSGIATAGGDFSFTVTVTDSAGTTASAALTVLVERRRWVAVRTGPAYSIGTASTRLYLLDLAATAPTPGGAGMPLVLAGTAAENLRVENYQFAPDGSSIGIQVTDEATEYLYVVRLGNDGATPGTPVLVHQADFTTGDQWGYFPGSSHLYWLDAFASNNESIQAVPVPSGTDVATPTTLVDGDVCSVRMTTSGWFCWTITADASLYCVQEANSAISAVKTIGTGADSSTNIYANGALSPVFTLTMTFAGTTIRRLVNAATGTLLADGSNSWWGNVSSDGNWFTQRQYVDGSHTDLQVFPVASAVTPVIDIERTTTTFVWSNTSRYLLVGSGLDHGSVVQPASIVDFGVSPPVETILTGAVGSTLAFSPDETWVSILNGTTLSVEAPLPTPPAAPSVLSTTAVGASFSPNSRYAAFAATPTSPTGTDAYLAELSTTGTMTPAIIHPAAPPRANGSNVGLPVWSVDSAYLAYLFTTATATCDVSSTDTTDANCSNKDLYTASLYGTRRGVLALDLACVTQTDCETVLDLQMQPWTKVTDQ